MTSITQRPRPQVAGDARRGFRLRRRAHKLALTAHILSSVGWFGIAAFVLFAFVTSKVTSDGSLSHALLRTVETSPWLSIPMGVLAVVTGVILSVGTTWGLVRHWWVVAKIVIAIVVIATDAFVLGNAAHDAVVGASSPGDLYGPTIAHTVVLAVATLLSVLKPRGRTPWGRRVAASTDSIRGVIRSP